MRNVAYLFLFGVLVLSPVARSEARQEGAPVPGGAGPIVIKIATIAPEGSTWMDIAHEYEDYVQKKIPGRVKFIWYAGGVLGDEPEIVRKMKLGQVQCAGFSGLGLGKTVPEVRVLELPLLFKSYDEVDYVLGKLDATFRKLFDDKGFTLLGWAEQGFIYVFTNKPVHKIDDLSGIKIWAWAGDNFAQTIFDSLGYLVPIPIAIPEVLTSLQTGMINAFYNPPLAAVALQWYTHVKYIVNMPFTYGTGATIMDKKTFNSYPADVRAALLDGAKNVYPKFFSLTRRDSARILENFPKQGITLVDPDPQMAEDIGKKMEIAYKKLTGMYFPEWLLAGVRRSHYEYRLKKK